MPGGRSGIDETVPAVIFIVEFYALFFLCYSVFANAVERSSNLH